MSSNQVEISNILTNIVDTPNITTKKEANLPDKFAKFIRFGYFIMKKYNKSLDDDGKKVDEESFLGVLNFKLF